MFVNEPPTTSEVASHQYRYPVCVQTLVELFFCVESVSYRNLSHVESTVGVQAG